MLLLLIRFGIICAAPVNWNLVFLMMWEGTPGEENHVYTLIFIGKIETHVTRAM